MDLLEYQGKQLLARHGIPMQSGRALTTVDDALAAADACGYPVVVKAQVRVGGRGKAGGIKLARDAADVREHATAILGMEIKGVTVRELWVGEALEIAEEYYASVVFDRRAKAPLVMLSRHGGVEIETVAEQDPDALATLHVDPLLGFQAFHGRRLAFDAGIAVDLVARVGDFLAKLYATFVGEEASLVEVNPLVVTPGSPGVAGERELVALDAKVTLDDNSLYRHPENAELRDLSSEDPQER
ncbi:MAG TPA: ATP-grasp domain-containing protein, partial [Solirubrobacteraceae bacterium]